MGPRVLLAKPGLDGHDRGVKVIAMALRDAGAEVVYLGLRCTADDILSAAVQEDVAVIGLSFLSGAHVPLTAAVLAGRERFGIADVPVIVGGTIPPADAAELLSLGVAGVFPVGTSLAAVTEAVLALAATRAA
jgi:methylmalonyl-CoA mutase C-terminal domain/subunit